MLDDYQASGDHEGEDLVAAKTSRFGSRSKARAQKPARKRRSDRKRKTKVTAASAESPYLRAREEWNERYGSYIQSRNNWRMIAFGSLLLSIPAVMFSLWQSGQTKVIPYVVEVDRDGQVRAAGPAQQIPFQPDYIIEAEIADFIMNFRVVTVDKSLQLDRLNEVYAFLAPGGGAKVRLDQYFRGGGNPFEVAVEKTRSVQIVNMNRVSPTSYSVQWLETEYDRTGQELDKKRFQSIVTYVIVPPESEQVIRTNPLGVYIMEIDYSEVTQ